MKTLDPHKTVFEEVADAVQVPDGVIRSFLGSFLFNAEAIRKPTKVLSGGERNRVAMVKVLLKKANFLLLDEPTNHLDLFAKEVLLQALQQFDGTMLFVSHDHTFLQGLATRIWELTPEGIVEYLGTYESYREQQRALQQQGPRDTQVRNSVHSKPAPDRTEKKRLTSLEQAILRQEKLIEKLQADFSKIAFGSQEYTQATHAYEQAQRTYADLMKEWEGLMN
jgi:ATP-binding cassette subfamily F protein 3